jgi:hypothetical protein
MNKNCAFCKSESDSSKNQLTYFSKESLVKVKDDYCI